ncbi:MAG: D-alanyl-D-alanine carboxypeptidase [Patulibacter sp.]|nr:D-alanyl-D-alanine carboxypeptidase [Patulibacter sp.]
MRRRQRRDSARRRWALVATTLAIGVGTASGAPAAELPETPEIGAPAAIAVEVSTGDVVFERRPDNQRSIASTTKLMTALVALEQEPDLEKTFAVPAYAGAAVESVAGLHAGDRMTMRDLLGGLLLPSGNDAANAIAVAVGGSVPRFVRMMNDKAREIGIRARFRNPVGLDASGHHASPADLVKLTLLLRQYPDFRRIVRAKSLRLESASPEITVVNRNRLVQSHDWVDGVKTGHTRKAGYALVGSGRRNGISVITVVLGTDSEAERDADSLALLRYATASYKRSAVLKRGAVVAELPLRYREQTVPVVADETVRRTIRRDERTTQRVTGLPSDVEGPLAAGARLGTIEVVQRGQVVARVPAVTAEAVVAASFGDRLDENLGRRSVQALLLVAVLCVVALAILARRGGRGRRRPQPAHEPSP